MKNLRGVCAAGWGEPCSALRNASVSEHEPRQRTGERSILSPTRSGLFLERLIYRYLSRSKKSRYLELALVALAEIPEADAEGVFPLDWTQYDMMNEGTILNLNFGFCLYFLLRRFFFEET